MSSIFRKSGALLAVAAVSLAASSVLAAPRDYAQAIAEVGVLARLDGKAVTASQFETADNPIFGLVGGGDARTLVMQRSLNGLRAHALTVLAPKLLDGCTVEATPADLTDFYGYWRMTAVLEASRLKALGVDDAAPRPALPLPGLTTLPDMPLKELALVGPQLSGSQDLAADAVRRWKTYHCVQAAYGGDGFFSIGVDRAGLNWPRGPLMAGTALDGKSVRVPDTGGLEPVTALGRFFRDAERRGLLVFDNPAHRAYFFDRYEGGAYDTMKEPARAKAYLAHAPWITRDDVVVVTGKTAPAP